MSTLNPFPKSFFPVRHIDDIWKLKHESLIWFQPFVLLKYYSNCLKRWRHWNSREFTQSIIISFHLSVKYNFRNNIINRTYRKSLYRIFHENFKGLFTYNSDALLHVGFLSSFSENSILRFIIEYSCDSQTKQLKNAIIKKLKCQRKKQLSWSTIQWIWFTELQVNHNNKSHKLDYETLGKRFHRMMSNQINRQ